MGQLRKFRALQKYNFFKVAPEPTNRLLSHLALCLPLHTFGRFGSPGRSGPTSGLTVTLKSAQTTFRDEDRKAYRRPKPIHGPSLLSCDERYRQV